MGNFLEKLGLLFISTSGHTGHDAGGLVCNGSHVVKQCFCPFFSTSCLNILKDNSHELHLTNATNSIKVQCGNLVKLLILHSALGHAANTARVNNTLSLVHTSRRLHQLSQRARSQQIIGNFSIFTAMDCDSRWSQQICS